MVKNGQRSIVAVTGHRYQSLAGPGSRTTGFRIDDEINRIKPKLLWLAEQELTTLAPSKVLTGMALGWDQSVAEACINIGIPFVACVPCNDQEALWERRTKERYRKLLEKAAEVVLVSPGPYAVRKMFRRNEYLVDNCELLLALWNGDYHSGTGHCVSYAERQKLFAKQDIEIVNCWEKWVKLHA